MGDIVESETQSGPVFDAPLPDPESFEWPFDLSVVSIAQFALDASGRGKCGMSGYIPTRPLGSIVCFRFGADRHAAAESEDERGTTDEIPEERPSFAKPTIVPASPIIADGSTHLSKLLFARHSTVLLSSRPRPVGSVVPVRRSESTHLPQQPLRR